MLNMHLQLIQMCSQNHPSKMDDLDDVDGFKVMLEDGLVKDVKGDMLLSLCMPSF